jgi:Fibronectin type III domain
MAHVTLSLTRLSIPELIDLAAHLEAGLDGNPHFPSPKPSLDDLKELRSKLATQSEAYRQQRLRLNELKVARDAVVAALSEAIVHEAGYVQAASGGDLGKIVSANLHAEPEAHLWPFRGLGQVHELAASAGDAHGEIDLSWDRVRGATGYNVEISTDLGGAGPWMHCVTTTVSRATIGHLESTTRYWFRVCAVNDRGSGKWSDPVTKFAR